MERYLRVNLLDRAFVLRKKNLPGRGLTKVEKHWYEVGRLSGPDFNGSQRMESQKP